MIEPDSQPRPHPIPQASMMSQAGEVAGNDVGPGKRYGRFVILRSHAEGGLGRVSLALDESVGRKVALKEIRPDLANSSHTRQRFIREAEITGQLEHPGIVPLYVLGQDEDGRPYYAMKFVEGCTLDKAIAEYHATPTPVAFQDLLRRFVEVCQAVAYAHSQGVIHRDLKPSNIMVGKYGETLILDWGLAKRINHNGDASLLPGYDEDEAVTSIPPASGAGGTLHGRAIGTPAYMPPEQAQGQLDQLGPSADIYALGAVLYQLLTADPPYSGSTKDEILLKVHQGSLAWPRHMRPAIPPPLRAVCLKAMAKRPEDRYRSAADVAGEIDRWLADEPVRAWREPLATLAARWARRHRAAVAVLAALLLSAVAALSVSHVLVTRGQRATEFARRDADEQRRSAQKAQQNEAEQRRIADEQRARAEQRESLARRHAYAAHMNLARQARESGEIGRTLGLLERHRPSPGHEDLRGFEWYYLWHESHRDRRHSLYGHMGEVRSVAFSPDGTTVASGGIDGTVRLWDVATGRLVKTLYGAFRRVFSVAFSPDGKTIAAGSEYAPTNSIVMWDVETGAVKPPLAGKSERVCALAFSPDGKTIAAAGGEWVNNKPHGELTLWDLSTGKQRFSHANTGPLRGVVAFSPDSMTLATGSGYVDGASVQLWDAATGEARLDLAIGVGPVAFSPDGRLVASALGGKTIKLNDVKTGAPCGEMNTIVDAGYAIAFSPDGSKVACGSIGHQALIWERSAARVWAYPHAGAVFAVAFSPDGTTLASGGQDGGVHLWDANPPREADGRVAEIGYLRQPLLSPGGQWVSYIDPGKSLRLRSVDTVGEGVVLPVEMDPVDIARAFAPDGTILATASGGDGRNVKLWRVPGGEQIAELQGHAQRVRYVVFSLDGTTLATAADDMAIAVWERDSGRRRRTIQVSSRYNLIRSLALSPDARRVAATLVHGQSDVAIWSDGEQPVTLPFEASDSEFRKTLAFSNDGKQLVVARDDGTIKVWDVEGRKYKAVFSGHASKIQSMQFLSDGRTFVTAGNDRTVKLWDTETWDERFSFHLRPDKVYSLSVDPDGPAFFGVTAGGIVRAWRAPIDRESSALKTPELDPNNPDSVIALNDLAVLQRGAMRYAEALDANSKAVAMLERLSSASLPAHLIVAFKIQRSLALWGRATTLARMGREREAVIAYDAVLALGREAGGVFPDACNAMAWMLTVSADPALRDPHRAVELATRAVGREPRDGGYWNTLGVAQYRTGAYQAAILALTKSMELGNGDAFDFFFLAMAHERLGDSDLARQFYDKGVKWMQAQTATNEELHRFRAEADETLLAGKSAAANATDGKRPPG